MNKNKIALILICSIFLITLLICCENQTSETNNSNEIRYEQTIPGGCNGEMFSGLKSTEAEPDTLIFSVYNDTLSMFIGINYICCAPFVSDISISNDSIFAEITDTCNYPEESCYCRCMCYYSWDFLFTGYEGDTYHYKVILNNPQEEEPIVFRQGIMNITSQ
ncbi:MAG: hypothetical protein JXR31_13900 [Prolixibacteraceae bacterium]|nr:hypothetical protein [Prolixibacteraceae bacterium]